MAGKNENKNYLSGREIRAIAKANAKEIKRLEAYKNRKAPESEFLSEMKDPANILEIEDLHTYFYTEQGVVKAVGGVSYDVPKHSVVGVVGESGCGKSVTSMSVMRLIQGPTGQIVEGSIRFQSSEYVRDEKGNPVTDDQGNLVTEDKVYDIAKMPIHEIHRIRGKQVAMIFQEPMTSLNPIFTIGQQLDEVTLIHVPNATKEQAKEKSYEMLRLVGIIPENVYKAFPHELSGGMRQRVMIAMALAAEPRLIIADEPTTALDVTIQAQILELLQDIKNKIDGSILLITHDLGVIAEMADYVVVMYAGKVIEKGTVHEIFEDPRHPYTIGLQKSKPTMTLDDNTELYNIPGNVPNPVNMPSYCYFKERCAMCTHRCGGDYPEMVQVSPTHFVACHLYGEEAENG
ncbi:MAG: ABC transporter ATP-binding protein [Clostridia bacterium]|nr:ABC transporter ATP-binding protein [Clostridia bacterium]MBQ9842512.1 ABC transporter ATP-binding protein [Clostridia bacterium]